MTQPAYPAARAAAARIYPHYARHLTEPQPGLAPLPDLQTVEDIIDVAFWASLRREEIYTPRISLAFVAPGQVDSPLRFERPVPLASQPLTRLGPAVERPGIHLCVWRDQSGLAIWGATRKLPRFCFVLEVVAPGLLVIKHSRSDDSGKFVNVAVLQGDEIKVVDQGAASSPGCPERLTRLLGLQADVISSDSVNVLIQLAVSMRAHGKGGTLLVAPARTESWRESILHPMTYSIAPAFQALGDLIRETPDEQSRGRWQTALRKLVDGIAGLTAVDGATIITDDYHLLAFGAKIIRRTGWAQVDSVIMTEAIEGTGRVVGEAGMLGGTRHLSAAQFTHDQRDAIALVASQEGRFTVFGWWPEEQMVYANRIESLLI